MRVPITITIEEAKQEAYEMAHPPHEKPQCDAVYIGGQRSGACIFCLRPKDHPGDHRGLGAQWT